MKRGIAFRLFLSVVFVATAVTIVAVALGALTDLSAERRSLEGAFAHIEHSHLAPIEQSVFRFDMEQLSLILEGIVLLPEIAYAEVREQREEGYLVLDTAGVAPRHSASILGASVYKYQLAYGETEDHRVLGELLLRVDQDFLVARLRRRLIVRIISAIVEIFVVALFIFVLVNRTMVKELRRVAMFVETIKLNGDPGPPLRLRRFGNETEPIDEIDEIAKVIDDMNLRLTSTYNTLVETRNDLSRTVRERETLLQEVYHRTKNNMQVIVSMMRLRASKDPDNPSVRTMVQDMEQRVVSMALVHQQLYRSGDLSRLNLGDYVRELLGHIGQTNDTVPIEIRDETDEATGQVKIDVAIPCGLILSELISNARKYAFDEKRTGNERIEIRVTVPREGTIAIEVEDNGRGLPEGFDIRRDGDLGIETIHALAEQQLRGTVDWGGPPGLRCTVTFPVGPKPSA